MNPIKIMKESLPQLTEVLESIHGHLEAQLETQKLILQTNQKILAELQRNREKEKST